MLALLHNRATLLHRTMLMNAQRQLQRATYADYLQVNDGKRYELIQGRYWLMAGAGTLHQRTVGEIHRQFANQLLAKPCRVFIAPYDVRLADAQDTDGFESNVVQPDLLISCDRSKETPTGLKGAPKVVIEVISPNGAGRDLVVKRRLYERAGVQEYWAFDPEGRVLHMHYLTGDQYQYQSVIARGILSLRSLDLAVDFDQVECAEGFTYPEEM
jgi:Uma2 family endonuclease